jgi:peptidoglycan hydrolase CwlO-like protein
VTFVVVRHKLKTIGEIYGTTYPSDLYVYHLQNPHDHKMEETMIIVAIILLALILLVLVLIWLQLNSLWESPVLWRYVDAIQLLLGSSDASLHLLTENLDKVKTEMECLNETVSNINSDLESLKKTVENYPSYSSEK